MSLSCWDIFYLHFIQLIDFKSVFKLLCKINEIIKLSKKKKKRKRFNVNHEGNFLKTF